MRSACAISGREIARIDTEITEYKISLFPPSLPSFPRFRNFDSERERQRESYLPLFTEKTVKLDDQKATRWKQHPGYCSINLLGGMYREYDSLFFRIEISFLLERRAVNFYASSENVSAIKY